MLYPYQQEGVDFLLSHNGGMIFDDPGLGKTRQAIVAAKRLGRYPVLVVCPSPLRLWWTEEIHKLYPNEQVHAAGVGGRFGKDNDGTVDKLCNGYFGTITTTPRWVVVHYTGLRLEQQSFADVTWGAVVADESHYVKSAQADRSKALEYVTPIDAVRIGLTATPHSTCVADLWSQLFWVSDEFRTRYPGYWSFFGKYVEHTLYTTPQGRTVKKPTGIKNRDELVQMLSDYAISRRKVTVAPQLPKLQETKLPLPLEDRQALVYRHLKKEAEIAVRDSETGEITGVVIKNALSRMMALERWLSCPWKTDSGVQGIKLEWLKEWAADYSEPAVIMTHFKDSAVGIATWLNCGVITGDVPSEKRQETLAAWQRGDTQFLVGTIGTLGTGLNLQRAYTLIFYDQVYSPILMRQAKDRIHRITTDHPVQAIYLTVQHTTNEVVYQSFSENLTQMEMVKRFLEYVRRQE